MKPVPMARLSVQPGSRLRLTLMSERARTNEAETRVREMPGGTAAAVWPVGLPATALSNGDPL